jgi:AAA+ ATPase superfamily predicted ATPase
VDQLYRMGSVRHRLSEFRQDCNVVLVGDVRVGKSALVNRFINNKFSEVSFVLFFCLKILTNMYQNIKEWVSVGTV